MEDIVVHISRNYITGLTGLSILGVATYLIRRYLSNTSATSNNHYIKSSEVQTHNPILGLSSQSRIVYIFWNGDLPSTYLLLDQLQLDKIVQPLYIERYTIIKTLEHDTLTKYTSIDNKVISNDMKNKVIEYLKSIARIKKNQNTEISHLDVLRRLICNQYPEFANNLLPTKYITSIAKDLEFTQYIYDVLKNDKLLDIQGIELYEEANRYIKNEISIRNNPGKCYLGYTQDSKVIHCIPILDKKIQDYIKVYPRTRKFNLETPLQTMNRENLKYLANNLIKNEIMRFLFNS